MKVITVSNLIRWGRSIRYGGRDHFRRISANPSTGRYCVGHHKCIHHHHFLKAIISLFGIFGITGIYARQVEETGWKGLAGYLLLTIYLCSPNVLFHSLNPRSCRGRLP